MGGGGGGGGGALCVFVPELVPNACLDLREEGRENVKKKSVRRKQRERECRKKGR